MCYVSGGWGRGAIPELLGTDCSKMYKCSEICSYAVSKNGLDEKHQLKVVVINMFVTFTSFQLFVSNAQQIYEGVSCIDTQLLSFPWRPGDLLCLVLFAVKNIMVLLLM